MKLEYLMPVVIIPALWMALLVIRIHLAKDRILRELHREHPDVWQSLGEPNGWQWSPPGRVAVPWRIWSVPRHDPEWLGLVPDVRAEFERIRALRHRLVWTALPIFAAGLAVFALAASLVPHP